MCNLEVRYPLGYHGGMSDPAVNDPEVHWGTVWGDKRPSDVSWFQATPEVSLRLIRSLEPSPHSVVDVGAGASVLVDRLLDVAIADVTVVDIAAGALEQVRARLGARGARVSYVMADVRTWTPDRTWDVWHDRAVLHFLTDPDDAAAYAAKAAAAVHANGHAVIGCFAPDGPEQCSGLPTVRRSADELVELFGPWFDEVHREHEVHRTPWQSAQSFTWVVLRRRAS